MRVDYLDAKLGVADSATDAMLPPGYKQSSEN